MYGPYTLRQAEDWPSPATLVEFERALDARRLVFFPNNVRGYDCRRNGNVRRWKRDPDRFHLGVKYAFREHVAVEHVDDFKPFVIRPAHA